MPPATTTITDNRFNALKAKLRELFELDKSDLDFGIYRIMAARNKEVTAFLDRQLKDVVKATLAAHGAGAADQVQADLDKAIEQARTLGADPDTLPRVRELRARLESAGGAASADLEADIYNHLLAFFSRYYDEGDFISQRRYKGDTYAIPYSGEEVTLHWANKDQYYIKSGEWHKDYRFKVGDGEKIVRFRLVEATQEAGNNKEADDARRRYILAIESPVEATASELTLRFEFRVPTQADKDRAAAGAVAIFGGDYAKPTNPKKGDDREQYCADAEKRAIAAMSEAWRSLVGTPGAAATADKPDRTLLGKHLDHFTARNTFDYFIHKDLGGFLRRELDFYIKNDVMRLDDLESLPPDHLQRVQGRVKAIRTVAGRLIAFLASIEDFQKKMWLKKKFVLNTNWLVTVDRIPPALRDVVAENAEQWAEWERLGFKPTVSAVADVPLLDDLPWATREYLDSNLGRSLVVDTAIFECGFKAELLATEEVIGGDRRIPLEEAVTGVLIHSENFQAVMLIQQRYRAAVKCIYLDPPYNTSEATFVYKNMYRHSSWLAMLIDRLRVAIKTISRGGCLQLAIDDAEFHRAKSVVDHLFGEENYLGTLAVQTNPRGRGINSHYATSHDYIICTSLSQEDVEIIDQPLTEEQEASYAGSDEESTFRLLPFRRSGGLSTPLDRPNSEFSIFVDTLARTVVGVGGPRATPYPAAYDSSHALFLDERGEVVRVDYDDAIERPNVTAIMPVDSDGGRRVWRWSDRHKLLMHARRGDFVVKGGPGVYSILLKDRIKGGRKPKTLWYDSKYDASSHGTNLIKDLLGSRGEFVYPKSLFNTFDALHSVVADDQSAVVLDYFAGSGTTGHAVVKMNRETDGGGNRKFILVEMGAYFHTVLKPRIAKVLYSPDWRGGEAQSHGAGVPGGALVKYFSLESYDDALNNLPAPVDGLLDGCSDSEKDALLTYALDLELGPHLLDLDAFRDPWGYTINAQLAGDAEIRRHRVDLVETFNYLIGLKVHAYGPVERYSADFERAPHEDGLGRLRLTGRLRRDANGPYVFHRVEGELNDGNSTRVLVVWRTLTDDPEKDAAVLDAWMARHRESTRERTAHRDYHLIYINGPVTLPQPTAEIRTVYPTEETFKAKMFEDSDGGGL
ncbi:MAG: site-specific DNA-methyltransferase [Phycisphaeraceae bacterium]|nr:site-specific DNA-methyltransferase [Phycisphaeraceae bacterium]